MSREDTRIVDNLLFQGVPREVAARFAGEVQLVDVATDAVVFESGDEANGLYLILEGGVRVSSPDADGRQVTLGYLEPRDFVGEMAALDGSRRSARATASCPTTLAYLPVLELAELIRLAPTELAANLAHAAVRRIRAMNERHVEESLRAERLRLVGQMAGTIVHDLKNPIGIVRNIAALLEEERDAIPPEKMAEMLQRSADQMLGMVQDILDFSRGGMSVSFDPTTIDELLHDLEEQMLAGLRTRGVEVQLRLDYTGELVADRRALVRGLLNIVKNAGEAMPHGGHLTIATERRGGELAIAIADTGHGIPSTVLPSVFEPFKTHGKSGGTGLGMAITRSAVEAHGGKIDVVSHPGEGTTFTVTIPLRR